MNYAKPVTELVQLRFSCRKFSERLLAADTQQQLRHCLSEPQQGPFRSNLRFALLANAEEDRQALQHLGTYGFIKGAAGFVVGAVKSGPHSLLDYGYAMEQLVLKTPSDLEAFIAPDLTRPFKSADRTAAFFATWRLKQVPVRFLSLVILFPEQAVHRL